MVTFSKHTLYCIERGAAAIAMPGLLIGGVIGGTTGTCVGASIKGIMTTLSIMQDPSAYKEGPMNILLDVLASSYEGGLRGLDVGVVLGCITGAGAGILVGGIIGSVVGGTTAPIAEIMNPSVRF